MVPECKHEFKPETIKWDKKYGRTGICKKCERRIFQYKLYHKLQRIRPKMKKKQRRKLQKELKK